MKAAFAYFGGKSGMASEIVSLMPPHRSYIEPFLGSGAVFFRKPRVVHEILNDLEGSVVNFFRVLRESPAEVPNLPERRRPCSLGQESSTDAEQHLSGCSLR